MFGHEEQEFRVLRILLLYRLCGKDLRPLKIGNQVLIVVREPKWQANYDQCDISNSSGVLLYDREEQEFRILRKFAL